jgi:HD-like signal output (HDOD) protein
VLSVGALSTVQPKTKRQRETMRQFWLHAFGTAAATQVIGRRKAFDVGQAEAVFVGGLLHDIGRLFLFTNFGQSYDEVIRYAAENGVSMEEAERRLMGMDHGQVGEAMAKQWKLPEMLVLLIGHHEGPFDPEAKPMQYCIHIGDHITKHLYFEVEAIGSPADEAVEWLGFSPREMELLSESTQEKIDAAAQLFGLLAAA